MKHDGQPRHGGLRRGALLLCVTLVGLVFLSICQRLRGINPPSLWIDDVWAALLIRDGSLDLIWNGSAPCPPGFVLLERLVVQLLGQSHWAYQIVPLMASLLLIVTVGWLLYWITDRWVLGMIGAALMAGNPTVAIYSLRVKPFTTDALLCSALLVLAVVFVRRRTAALFPLILVGSLIAAVSSFVSVLFTLVLVHVLAGYEILSKTSCYPRRKIVFTLALYDALMSALYFWILAPHGNPEVTAYWKEQFLPWNDPGVLLAFLNGPGAAFFWGAFPARLTWLVVFVPIAIVMQFAERRIDFLVWFAVSLFAAVFVASASRIYPMGGGRTDIFAYPVVVTLAVLGIDRLTRKYHFFAWLAGIMAAGTLLFEVFSVEYLYPLSSQRAVIDLATKTVQPDDGLVVYPCANWALGFYGKWSHSMVPLPDTINGFYVVSKRENTIVLQEEYNGRYFAVDPSIMGDSLRSFLDKPYPRIVYVASNVNSKPHRWIKDEIVSHQYRMEQSGAQGDSCFMVFRRVESVANE